MTRRIAKIKWPLVVTEWDKPYLFYIHFGNYNIKRMCVFKTLKPRAGLYVSIEGNGSHFFLTEKRLIGSYVNKQLKLLTEGNAAADFLNAQIDQDGDQQGIYPEPMFPFYTVYNRLGEFPHEVLSFEVINYYEESYQNLFPRVPTDKKKGS